MQCWQDTTPNTNEYESQRRPSAYNRFCCDATTITTTATATRRKNDGDWRIRFQTNLLEHTQFMLPSSCICCAYISDTCGVIVLLTVTVAMNIYFSAVWKNVCAYLCANVCIFQYRRIFVLLASVVILCMTYFSAWPIRSCTVRYVLKYNVCHNP